MSEIKLEVGKTYRSRQGKEVRIVRKTANGRPPFQGSDGEWYTENGRWQYFGAEFPEDLIKEIPETQHTFALVAEALTATRYTFTIPEGTKGINVSKEGDRIVVEMVPEAKEPKPGDVMINKYGNVYIFKEDYCDGWHYHFAYLKRGIIIDCNGLALSGRPATPEEAQPLWDALKKAGKRWNAETMQVEEVPEIDRIREWAEKHYSNHQGIAEAIEAYLKYRGGK